MEGRIGLDTVDLDVVAGLDEGQQADLRMPVGRGSDEGAVPLAFDEAFNSPWRGHVAG